MARSILTPEYRDRNLQLHPTTWEEVFAAAQRIKSFFDSQRELFPGRQNAIDMLMYAVMTRHHIILTGPHGTAKSLLANTVLNNLEGNNVRVFKKQLAKTMQPHDVLGALDIKALRETGHHKYNVEGYLTASHFGRLGELLDANDMLLRALNDAIHERVITLGTDLYHVPLMTLIADTNFRIEDEPERAPFLAAVLDRFLFQADVRYLATSNDLAAMLMAAADNKFLVPRGKLRVADIELVSGTIMEMNLVGSNSYVINGYSEAMLDFRKRQEERNRIQLSDRRITQTMAVMEAHAIINGRTGVQFEDVDIVRMVICGDEEENTYFTEQIPKVLEVWTTQWNNRAVEAERTEVQQVIDLLPQGDVVTIESETDILAFIGEIRKVHEALETRQTKNAVVAREVHDHIVAIEERLSVAELHLFSVLARALPGAESIPGTPVEKLQKLIQHVRGIRTICTAFKPIADTGRTQRRELIDVCHRLEADIVAESDFMVKDTA